MAQDRQYILFTAGELGGMIGAACKGNLDAPIREVVTDSRLVRAGVLFVALRGSRVDGHRFIEDACRAGAAAVMAEMAHKDMALAACRNAGCMDRACLLLVESTLSGLQAAARAYRRRMNLFRIGVTGSSGKTTTKECIGAILRACYPDNTVAMNEGNLNSDIGLALAMFTLRPEHRIGVFEMGMNRKGEMDELVAMYEPDMAVITNIGTAHLGMLGSRQAIAEEKKKIFSRFTGSQRGFIWENDEYRDFLARDVQGTILEFGPKSTRGLEQAVSLGIHGWRLIWKGQSLQFPLPGEHNLLNACAALSVADALALDPPAVARGLASVKPLFGRSELRTGRITVLQDCYNANPESMAAALELVGSLPWEGRKVLVLGSMLELGEEAAEAHRRVLAQAFAINPAAVFAFGEDMAAAAAGLQAQESGTVRLVACTDMQALIETVCDVVQDGDLVLIKGSRGMALERLTEALASRGLIDMTNSSQGGSHAS